MKALKLSSVQSPLTPLPKVRISLPSLGRLRLSFDDRDEFLAAERFISHGRIPFLRLYRGMNYFASSKGFVGGFRLGQIAERMIQRHLQHFERLKSTRFPGAGFTSLFCSPMPRRRPLTLPSPPGEEIRLPCAFLSYTVSFRKSGILVSLSWGRGKGEGPFPWH